MLHTIGEISLDLSTIIYFIWFLPQIYLTFKRGKTSGLSLWMHAILVMGYLADLIYGFGRELPLQYRLVTISGLIYLAIEHYQFHRYGLKTKNERNTYYALSMLFLGLLSATVWVVLRSQNSHAFYDVFGLVSTVCWLTFFIPQIIKNYVNKSASGLSLGFVWLSVASGILDTTSAYALGYAWPSKISAPLGLLKKTIVLSQCYYYQKKSRRAAINAQIGL